MATADEIFVMTAEEPHIVIDPDRTIKIPNSLKRLAVQHDHNIETVTFDCPRYWDDHDMSKMAVYINYMLSDGYTDSYPVDNVTVDGDIMHFTWTISRNVTHVSGVINFLVCVKNTDDEGNEVNHWNSELCQDAYISKGMENEEIGALEQTDLITSLLLRMDSVEKINIKADEMQALLDEAKTVVATAEEVKNEALDVSNHIKNSYANALNGNANGAVVRIDDVSPIKHTVNTRLYGKNLCSANEFDNSNSATRIINPIGAFVKKGKKYTFSCNATYVNETATDKRIQFVVSSNKKQEQNAHSITDEIAFLNATSINATGTFNHTFVSIVEGYLYIRVVAANVFTLSEIQIEEGDTATEYEPYVDPTAVTVSRYGKNLISYPYTHGEIKTTNGITFKVNADRSIIATGTATADAFFNLSKRDLDNIEFIKTDCSYDSGNKYAYISVSGGTTVNKVFRPQIEAGSVATEWEPPSDYNDYTPDQNGDVAITSASPTMTLFTDTDGITIDLEYNRDTNKAFAELVEMINSK